MRNLAQFWGLSAFFLLPGYDKIGLPCRLYWEQGGEGVQVVYVDVLLVVNFFMTLLLLLLTAALTKQPRRIVRLCIAAMLGRRIA